MLNNNNNNNNNGNGNVIIIAMMIMMMMMMMIIIIIIIIIIMDIRYLKKTAGIATACTLRTVLMQNYKMFVNGNNIIYVGPTGRPAARSKASVCGRSPAQIVGSNPTGGHGSLSVVSVVCCQVEVSATG